MHGTKHDSSQGSVLLVLDTSWSVSTATIQHSLVPFITLCTPHSSQSPKSPQSSHSSLHIFTHGLLQGTEYLELGISLPVLPSITQHSLVPFLVPSPLHSSAIQYPKSPQSLHSSVLPVGKKSCKRNRVNSKTQ